MVKHGNTERHILSLFKESAKFSFKDQEYSILKIGKPTPRSGECKTDIYILAIDNNSNKKEFKISIKQNNADFLENKMTIERAKKIFGEDASNLLMRSTEKIKCAFENDFLINLAKYKRTEPNCIKIGWKFELVNKISGEKSSLLELSREQKIDIYAGTNLSIEKRNSKVNYEVIEDSGVANYILEVHSLIEDLNFYLDKMLEIEEFAEQQNIYFACKAINYRVNFDKWDGNRPLAVYCNWFINDYNKLDVEIIYNNPLKVKADAIGNNIRHILKTIGLNRDNFPEIKNMISDKVKMYNNQI